MNDINTHTETGYIGANRLPKGELKITLIKRNLWYYLWKYSNGIIPFIKMKFLMIHIKGLNTDKPVCVSDKKEYELWECDFGIFKQIWLTMKISDKYEGGQITEMSK
jgi:hypothetical protein